MSYLQDRNLAKGFASKNIEHNDNTGAIDLTDSSAEEIPFKPPFHFDDKDEIELLLILRSKPHYRSPI